jgi:hypothetical protein
MRNSKGTLKGFVAGVLFMALLMPAVLVFANTVVRELTFGVRIQLDGVPLNVAADSQPFITEGRTFLPVRAIADAVGREVVWDAATQTVHLNTPGSGVTVVPQTSPSPTAQYLPDVAPAYAGGGILGGLPTEISFARSGGSEHFTMGGVRYYNAIRVHGRSGNMLFNLNGQYTRFTGIIGHLDGHNNNSPVQIWGDGVLLREFALPRNTHPEEFSIDITGVRQLRITRTTNVGYACVLIGNPMVE